MLEISMRTWPVEKIRDVRMKATVWCVVKMGGEVNWWMRPSPQLLPGQVSPGPAALGTLAVAQQQGWTSDGHS